MKDQVMGLAVLLLGWYVFWLGLCAIGKPPEASILLLLGVAAAAAFGLIGLFAAVGGFFALMVWGYEKASGSRIGSGSW